MSADALDETPNRKAIRRRREAMDLVIEVLQSLRARVDAGVPLTQALGVTIEALQDESKNLTAVEQALKRPWYRR